MSQGRQPGLGAMSGSYPLHQGSQFMNQHGSISPGPGPGLQQQRTMMGGQMPVPMYGHPNSQPQMYMPSSQQPPGSPAGRPHTPQQSQLQQSQLQQSQLQHSQLQQSQLQQSQLQQMQSAMQMSSTPQLSPVHSDYDSAHEINNPEDSCGEYSRNSAGVPRPTSSPVGSTGSRSNTPASIPGSQAGSPMPVRPPSGQADGQSRLTQSPMATPGYNQQMMPPPNSMGYMPTPGKMGGSQAPAHYAQYNPQYPQGNYGRQQPNMVPMSGPPSSGPIQSYPGPQPHMYPNGPGQMPGAPMYGNMPGMVRSMGQQGYTSGQGPYPQSNTNMAGMINSHYPGYAHLAPVAGHHSMQQTSEGSSPGPAGGPVASNMIAQHGGMMSQQHISSNKAAMLAAAGSPGPRMPHSRGSMSPSRGMFVQSVGSPLGHINSMANSSNLGSPSLNSMSNAVEQLTRSSSSGIPSSSMGNMSTSASSPLPKSSHVAAAMNNTLTSIANSGDPHLLNAEIHESLSRPNSAMDHLPNESTMGSDSLGGMPSDSTSVDSGFHSSDQSDKASDSVSTPTQSVSSPPLPCHPPNGDTSRTIENISPPDHPSHHPQHHLHHLHQQHLQQHYHMGPDSKIPYISDVPPSAMSLMPLSSNIVVTTASTGPLLTSVTQSIASPVTSISTSATANHPHQHLHMGPHGGTSHMMGHGMGPGPLVGMLPNGMSPGMVNPGHMGGPNQVPPDMGGHIHGMMPPNMRGLNMNQNGPVLGQMIGHNGPMLSGHPGINTGGNNTNMPPMGQVPPPQQMNCVLPKGSKKSKKSSSKNTSEDPPEKKRKQKELEGQGGPRLSCGGPHYSEEPNSPGAIKTGSDLSKLFELGPEPDRRHFLERIFAFLDESGQPVTALPVVSKTPLDIYKLYFSVREKGGFEEVTKSKTWRDICAVVNIGTSASAAFTLKKNYIRYLLNYECKFDRGGISPAPILAQMEAQLQHKREQKNRRAPSPAGSNSSESFRPPSVSNSQMDSPYQPPNMPPPYMQNPDGNMPNLLGSGSILMGPNNMMGGPGPHGGMGNMMAGPPGMGPSGMMVAPGSNMMHGHQGMMVPNSGSGNMMGSQMSGGPPGYGGPMMAQQQVGPAPQPSSNKADGPSRPNNGGLPPVGPMPATASDIVTAHDPFADSSGYQLQRGPPHQPTPPPPSGQASTSTLMASGYAGMQPGSMGSSSITSSLSQPVASAVGYAGSDQMPNDFPTNSAQLNEPTAATITTSGQFPFGQQFESSDRFEGPTPNMPMRPPGPTPDMPPSQQPPQQPGDGVYPGPRFPGPHQSAAGMRPSQGADVPGQYPQPGPAYQGQGGFSGPPYLNYPPTSAGPLAPPGPPGVMYGTPNKRLPDDHPAANQYSDWSNSSNENHLSYSSGAQDRQAPSPEDRLCDGGQWSPVQRSRLPQSGPGYMSPAPPSTPPSGHYGRRASHKNSPQSRDVGRHPGHQKMPPSYGGLAAASLAKAEVSFPPDSVEGIRMCTAKRKKLTGKDLAPFEPWRLMLSLKSGLLAESTWALDTLNILLYDDSTYGYFGLNKLPGLLEVLTEHLRHCLMQMFTDFEDLEGLSRKRERLKPELASTGKLKQQKEGSELKDEVLLDNRKLVVLLLPGSNFTMTSRKGMPVKIDQNPSDSSVLDAKEWDVFCNFDTKPDHWVTGHGDITDHVLTHLESGSSNKFLSGQFRRKRTRRSGCSQRTCHGVCVSNKMRSCDNDNVIVATQGGCSVDSKDGVCPRSVQLNCACVGKEKCEVKCNSRLQEATFEHFNSELNHSSMCNSAEVVKQSTSIDSIDSELNNKELSSEQQQERKSYFKVEEESKNAQNDVDGEKVADNVKILEPVVKHERSTDGNETDPAESACLGPVENNKEPTAAPVLNHLDSGGGLSKLNEAHGPEGVNSCSTNTGDNLSLVKYLDGDENADRSVHVSVKSGCTGGRSAEETISLEIGENVEMEEFGVVGQKENGNLALDDGTANNSMDTSLVLNESYQSETEELSASVVAEMLKEDEHLEEEPFQRDDPPLCVTSESRDELGRRCVCVSNIIRSLSCVPGNEDHISRHPGIMRVLGQLLLLHHSHPEKPPPRKLPVAEEDEREQSPRVYDDKHWWWDYLDQLRENTLVIIANICGHLRLGNFSEQVCFPLLEGLLHWVICPSSVARDPLPTLPVGSVISPQRLVLEALCKLCIHENNVDLLLATPPVKRLLELFGVLVHLLADRNHQITREFSIVLLSLLVSSESTAARAVALQHPSVSLLVDFLETAEHNAVTIANQQGLEVLQVNPEIMGTSPDMLRRAASILLHMARVPDNRKMFVQQQSRLLNLVMSQILDQTVSNILAEVLFECSQAS